MDRINGVCKCGAKFWIEPNPYTIPGCADHTHYVCKNCGTQIASYREDSMVGSCSDNVRLE